MNDVSGIVQDPALGAETLLLMGPRYVTEINRHRAECVSPLLRATLLPWLVRLLHAQVTMTVVKENLVQCVVLLLMVFLNPDQRAVADRQI